MTTSTARADRADQDRARRESANSTGLSADQIAKVNAPLSTPQTTTKRAASNAKTRKQSTKSAPKTTTTKRAASSTASKTTGPSDRELRRNVTAHLVKVTVDAFVALPSKTVKGQRYVTVNGQDIPRATALAATKQLLGYVAADLWDARLGVRDVGRPIPTKSAA
jgi:hypothetical protein